MRFTVLIVSSLLAVSSVLGQTAGTPVFVDVTESMGVAVVHRPAADVMRMGVGTGAAWLDFDRDGDLDLYLTQGEGPNALFRNDGGVFVDVAESVGAGDANHAGAGVAVGDYDNDGWLDLFLANSDADVLLHNNAGTGFSDVTSAAGLPFEERARGTAAAWGDYDGDGWLDLYVTNHMDMRGLSFDSQDRLYHNEGDGTFVDVSHLLGLDLISGYGFVGAWTDFDNDGDADLLLINDCPFGDSGRYKPSLLFRNDGGPAPHNWIFTEVGASVSASHCRHGMGLGIGDYNRDGWLDYFFTNIGKRTTLLTNDQGLFHDRATEAGVLVGLNPGEPGAPIQGTFTWGANFFDYDLDGWQDLYVVAGSLMLDTSSEFDPQPNALFRNNGDSTFSDVSEVSGLDLRLKSRTSVLGDYDGDGDLDLFVVSIGEDVRLYRNDSGEGNHWLVVKTRGTVSNTDGIGARVIVSAADGLTQHYEIRSGSSLGGGDEVGAFFGLGVHPEAETVEVRWPSGEVDVLTAVAADQVITVVESESTTATEAFPVPEKDGLRVYPIPSPGSTTIEYRTTSPSIISMAVYDMVGRRVARVYDGHQPGGSYRLIWDGRDERGVDLAPGVYVLRLTAGAGGEVFSRVYVRL